MKKVILDAGHGLYTKGKQTPDGIKEWSLNSSVCNFITEYLKEYNVQVCRTDDVSGIHDVSLKERVKKTNSIKPDLFISIHHNAMKGVFGNHSGIEVYTHTFGSAVDKEIATKIASKLSDYTGLKNRGVKKALFYVLGCKKEIPAVLVEGGFMDSNIDYKIITTTNGKKLYAKAVAEVIIDFLGLGKGNAIVPPKPSIPTTQKSVSEIAREVIAGIHGNGSERKINIEKLGYNYAEVQNEVNRILSGKKPVVQQKSVHEIAKEVIAGIHGNGAARKNNVEKLGYNYAEVQNEVNKILGAKPSVQKKSVHQIAKEVVAGKWGNGAERKRRIQNAGYNYAEVQREVNKMI